jgi:hypothetical protein
VTESKKFSIIYQILAERKAMFEMPAGKRITAVEWSVN